MGFVILALFIAVPVIEIGLFIEVGGRIGTFATIGLIVLTAFIGTGLLRQQGLATLRRAQQNLDAGQFPVSSLFDGLCLFVAGILLLTPGFFTDAIGFLLFVPPLRRGLGLWLARHLKAAPGSAQAAGAHWQWQGGVRSQDHLHAGGEPDNGVIEGDYEVLAPDSDPDNTDDAGPKDGTK